MAVLVAQCVALIGTADLEGRICRCISKYAFGFFYCIYLLFEQHFSSARGEVVELAYRYIIGKNLIPRGAWKVLCSNPPLGITKRDFSAGFSTESLVIPINLIPPEQPSCLGELPKGLIDGRDLGFCSFGWLQIVDGHSGGLVLVFYFFSSNGFRFPTIRTCLCCRIMYSASGVDLSS